MKGHATVAEANAAHGRAVSTADGAMKVTITATIGNNVPASGGVNAADTRGMEPSGRQGARNWEGEHTGEYGGWQTDTGNWRGRRDMGGMQGHFSGRGPRNYKRSDQRVEEDINEQLTQHPMIDATDIEVNVHNGEVTLRGHVDHRNAKRLAEDIAESVFGVKEINNQIKVKQYEDEESGYETETSGKRERKVS